jgi:hypothetical protein
MIRFVMPQRCIARAVRNSEPPAHRSMDAFDASARWLLPAALGVDGGV